MAVNQIMRPRSVTHNGNKIDKVRNVKIELDHKKITTVVLELIAESVEIDEGGNVAIVSVAPVEAAG